jgi:hypothetical protein
VLDPVILRMGSSAVAAGRRAVLLDAGATFWGDAGMTGLAWLVRYFAASGIVFTDIFCWEANTNYAKDFFVGMPDDVVARTRFYSLPVSNAPSGGSNPLHVLEANGIQPEDFVVYKLDIDAAALEADMVASLLRDTSLVDIFFHEHHINLDAMVEHWSREPGVVQSLNQSFEMFAALRRSGVLASTWP